MSSPDKFKITCYMAWCGAEATFPFSSKEAYEKARASLEKIAVAHARKSELPPRYANVTDFYAIDTKDRAVFDEIMRSST